MMLTRTMNTIRGLLLLRKITKFSWHRFQIYPQSPKQMKQALLADLEFCVLSLADFHIRYQMEIVLSAVGNNLTWI